MTRGRTATRPHVVLGSLAAGLGGLAACVAVVLDSATGLAIATLAHLVAARLCVAAARKRRPDLTAVEQELVSATGVLLPVFGPALAWCIPAPAGAGRPEDAHEVFERYSEHVKPHVPDYERTLFTGDFDRDLARELDVESYHEVLRHGSTDQKRNALARLADLGQPRHFALIRRCLLDPEHEVRLYAYSELERAGKVFENEIAERSREIERDPIDAEAQLAAARAYFGYARSGIHDEAMAAFYYRSAEGYAAQAARAGGPAVVTAALRAHSLAKLGEFEQARAVLDGLSESDQGSREACVARADLAYRQRDFAAVRAEARRLEQGGDEAPDWMRVMGGAE